MSGTTTNQPQGSQVTQGATATSKPTSAPLSRSGSHPSSNTQGNEVDNGKGNSSNTATNSATSVPPVERQPTGGDLSDHQRARVAVFDANKDLQELCRDNGLSASQFAKKATTVAVLDTFLGFWPSMKSVMHFPALVELSIVKHPTIVAIEGLENCPNLEQLTISECGLERLDGLSKCTKLKKLNLSSNKIKSIEHLQGLDSLEEIWLNDNRIDKLEGLWGAKQLRSVWICCNRIERIESAFNGCVNLTEISMAGNRVCSFKTLLSLANLDQLTVLTLSDPHFGDNPVCRLCNYQTYLMCQLPRLTWLDTVEMSTRNKQIAEATMLKKKMYYNMRIKTIKRDVQQRLGHANDVRRHTELHVETNIAALMRYTKELEQVLTDSDSDASGGGKAGGTIDLATTKAKLDEINACLKEKCLAISRMNHDYETLQTRLQWTADVNISRLHLELETGGNIRLEDGNPGDPWYASCVDLVKSRLFPSDLRPFGISDVKITRVTRINNRYLRNRFHARMEEILVVNEDQVKANVSKKGVTVAMKDGVDDDDDPYDPSSSASGSTASFESNIEHAAAPGSVPENSLEYLFYVQPPVMDQLRKSEPDQFYAAEYGFRDPAEYRSMGLEGAIKLSNSVSLLDTSRLLAAFAAKGAGMQRRELSVESVVKYSTLTVQGQEKELRNEFTREMREAAKLATQGEWEIPGGVLLVVKVFPGYTKVAVDNETLPTPVDCVNHTGLHSLQVLKTTTTTTTSAETTKQKMYYMFDKTLVLPEYLVEFDYVSTASTMKTMEAVLSSPQQHQEQASPLKTTAKSSELDSAAGIESGLGAAGKLADDFERRYRIRRPPSPQTDDRSVMAASSLPVLDEAVARILSTRSSSGAIAGHESMLPMTRVTLVESGRLTSLNLLGCQMVTMPDLSAAKNHLEVLILSYNRLTVLHPSLCFLSKLKELDVSSNRLTKLEHINTIDTLTFVDASHNEVHTFDDIPGLVYTTTNTKTQCQLLRLNLRRNPICATKRYRLHMLRTVGSQLEMLDEQAVTRDECVAAQRLLTILSSDTLLAQYRATTLLTSSPPSISTVITTSDASSIRNQADERAACWSAVEELHLNREFIRNIDGFGPFVNLRILSFADNVITHINGLESCVRLEELNLEANELTQIEHLGSLSFLKRLNLARNRLQSIDQLDSLTNLTQLSLEDNQISSLRGLSSAMKLMELYIGNNRIENLKEVQHLKALPKLTILDLAGNELTRLGDYRLYSVYYLRRVKVLDGLSVSPQDQSDAKQKYSGKLTLEFILEKCGGSTSSSSSSGTTSLERLMELDLSSCRIRELGSISGKVFPSLRELNLENNQITEISGLEALPKLRVLNLNRNRLERLAPIHGVSMGMGMGMGGSDASGGGKGILSCTKLEQLFLAYNQINDMSGLGLQHLDNLKVLHLQANAIVFFAGLDTNTELIELRLDKNKIRQLDAHSTTALRRLRVLSLDDNGLRTLSHFNELLSVEFLDLSNNRISDLDELDKLGALPSIMEFRLLNNPIVKKHLYRHTILFKLNTLRNLDGREVTAEERERVEVLFLHERSLGVPMMMNQPLTLSQGDRAIAVTNSAQFSLTPSTIPGKPHLSASTTSTANGAPMIIMTSNGARSISQHLSVGDMLGSSVIRKNLTSSIGFSSNQQPMQTASTFPKPDQPSDASIAIAPSSTTTKSLLLSNSNLASGQMVMGSSSSAYRSYSFSNGAHSGGSSAAVASSSLLTSPSSTATVASAFNASLSNTGCDQLNLGALRFDRRRMNSVHYDPAFNSQHQQMSAQTTTAGPVGMPTGASSLAGSVITSNALLRGHQPLHASSSSSSHNGGAIHPLSADLLSSSPKAYPTTTTTPMATATDPAARSFSGYVVSFANQKRFGALASDRANNAAELAATLASAAKTGAVTSGRQR